MKKLAAILIILSFISPAVFAAEAPKYKYKTAMPQGTFKKKRDGTIVQYDKRGKKVGTYKLQNGSYQKIKK